jgi:hypothetical protein
MSQSHLRTDRISDSGSYFIRCLSFTWAQTGYQTTEVISYDVSNFRCLISCMYLGETETSYEITSVVWYPACTQVRLRHHMKDNGSYFIRCLSLTWEQTGYQRTEVISYDVSVSPKHRQDVRQRKLFHTMSQSHLSTDRISDNGSYFIRCFSLT